MLKIESNKISVSWWDMVDLIKDLAEKIPFEVPLADSIYGIPRGGMIPAVWLSHETGLPLVQTLGKNTLIVDDMTDSGVTMEKMPGQWTAVLFHKPHTSCFTPNVYSKLHKGDEWLVFPWEKSTAPAIQDYLKEDQDEFVHLADANYIGGLTIPKENTNKVGKNG